MKVAATAISTTAMARPTTSTQVWPLAAPATASTLSSDMDTSAITIWVIALQKPSVPRAARRRRPGAAPAGLGTCADLAVHLPAHPQQQDAAGERQADDGEQLHGNGGEGDAQDHRADNAPEDDLGAQLGATREAARPTTMALSPARTTSMMTTWARARVPNNRVHRVSDGMAACEWIAVLRAVGGSRRTAGPLVQLRAAALSWGKHQGGPRRNLAAKPRTRHRSEVSPRG